MKKMFIAVSILLIAVSCKQKTQIAQQHGDTAGKLDTPTQTLKSLNGYNQQDALRYIYNFQKNPGNYNSTAKTNIWFNQQYVHDVRVLIDAKGYDGIRVYYAKTDSDKYTFVLVPTKDAGPRVDTPSKRLHKDFYESSAFLYSSEAIGIVNYGTDPGALLYQGDSVCPVIDNCPDDGHHLLCSVAAKWVNSFSDEKYVTKAEWYDKLFIQDLDSELMNETNSANGIRIYYAKHNIDGRHCFVVVTTKKGKYPRQDYFECVSTKHEAGDKGELCPASCNPQDTLSSK